MSFRFHRYAVPTLTYFSYMLAFRLFYAFVPIYLKEQAQLSQREISLLFMVFPAALLLMQFPFGVMADRVSPRRLVTAGLALLACSIWLLQYVGAFVLFLLDFSAMAVGVALVTMSISALYFKGLGATRHGAKLGFYNGLRHLGYGLGPFIGGFFLHEGRMGPLFVVSTLILLPFIALSFLLEPHRPEKFPFRRYGEDLRRPQVLFFLFLVFVFSTHFGVENVCLTLFYKDNLHLASRQIGDVFLASGVLMCVLGFGSGVVADRLGGGKWMMYAAMALSGGFHILMVTAGGFEGILAIRMGHVIGDTMWALFLSMTIVRLFPAARVGAPAGLVSTVETAGMLAGTLLAGFVPGYGTPFVVVGALSLLLIPLSAYWTRTRRRAAAVDF